MKASFFYGLSYNFLDSSLRAYQHHSHYDETNLFWTCLVLDKIFGLHYVWNTDYFLQQISKFDAQVCVQFTTISNCTTSGLDKVYYIWWFNIEVHIRCIVNIIHENTYMYLPMTFQFPKDILCRFVNKVLLSIFPGFTYIFTWMTVHRNGLEVWQWIYCFVNEII